MKEVKRVFLTGRIDEEGAGYVYEKLTESVKELKAGETIELIINSGGGGCRAAFGIYDFITENEIPVITKGFGRVESSALIVFLAGKKRFLSSHSCIRIHSYGTTEFDGTTADLGKRHKDLKRLQEATIEIMVEKTRYSRKQLLRFFQDGGEGKLIYHDEAKKFGLTTDC